MDQQRRRLLEDLLFQRGMSRNMRFELFESDEGRQLHRTALRLKSLHHEMQSEAVVWSRRELPDGRICLQLQHPRLQAERSVFLSPEEMELLEDLRWFGGHC